MYDPLLSNQIPHNQPYPDSYWINTIDNQVALNPLTQDISIDTAIIGAGYAGLSCAYHLAKNYGDKAVVLEANGIGWGCSGRNAGFVLPLSGRLGYEALVKRFGLTATQSIHQAFLAGVDLVETLIQQSGADVDKQPDGYLKIAHRPKYYDLLRRQADYMREHFGYHVDPISKQQLSEHYVDHHQAYGALRYRQGYGIHPMKLCMAYYQLVLNQGGKVFSNSPVRSWHKDGKFHLLQTPQGTVKAKNVVCCTNGYTPNTFHPSIDKRFLPVQTCVIVTRPLTASELQQSQFQTNQVMMDTRQLKYYYRKLADNRILFGGRGAISGRQADSGKYYTRLLQGLKRSFPALSQLTIEHQWSGWINVSLDDIPHIYQSDNRVFYAGGYCGAGLSFATLAGQRLAEKVAGDTEQHQIAMLTTPLPKFPLSPLRRLGQGLFYEIGRIRDSWF